MTVESDTRLAAKAAAAAADNCPCIKDNAVLPDGRPTACRQEAALAVGLEAGRKVVVSAGEWKALQAVAEAARGWDDLLDKDHTSSEEAVVISDISSALAALDAARKGAQP